MQGHGFNSRHRGRAGERKKSGEKKEQRRKEVAQAHNPAILENEAEES